MGRYSRLSPLGKNYYVLAKLFSALSMIFRTLKHSLPLHLKKKKSGRLFSIGSPGFMFFRGHYRAKYGKDTDFERMWRYDLDAGMRERYEALAKSSVDKHAIERKAKRQRRDG